MWQDPKVSLDIWYEKKTQLMVAMSQRLLFTL